MYIAMTARNSQFSSSTAMDFELETWYNLHNCTHAHCPEDCEHSQPFVLDGVMYCGKHYFDTRLFVEMIPCTPEVCT